MQLNKVSISSCPTLNDFAMVHAKIIGNDMNLLSFCIYDQLLEELVVDSVIETAFVAHKSKFSLIGH